MYSMNYIGKFISNFRDFYNEINTATLTGAIDVIVVEQPDGTFTCSPFHVRFGKLGVLRSREKVVDIEINGEPLDIHMKLGDSGEAFFVEELSFDELSDEVPPHLACSPIPTESGFPPHYHEPTLDKLEGQTEEWSRRRCNSEVVKRAPKEAPTQKFAQDDIDEHKPSCEISYEWGHDYGCAAELPSSDGFSKLTASTSSASAEPSVATSPTSLPKTFKAETVSPSGNGETARKLSTVSGEFRPINDGLAPESSPSGNEPSKAASVDVTTPDEVAEESSKSSSINKRRRRKRSVMKKKVGSNAATPQRKNSEAGEASDTSASVVWESATSILSGSGKPGSEVAVFTMDDVDGLQGTSPSPSSSTAADTMSPDSSTSPIDHSKASATLAAEISRDLSKIQNSATDFHFFSDTEILPGNNSPDEEDSRPCSPIQSDTEFETNKRPSGDVTGQTGDSTSGVQQSWRWGELPSPPPKLTGSALPASNTSSDDEATKQQDNGDCTSLQRDEDAESGNGPSLPQSPHSVEGAIGGPKSLDSDFEEPKHSFYDNKKHLGDVSMSLCGNLNSSAGSIAEKFLNHLVTFEDLASNPKLLEDPNLVVRYDGQYYNWKTASPLIMSLMVFRRPLPHEVLKNLTAEYMPNTQVNLSGMTKPSENVTGGRGYSSWFYWRRNEPKKMSSDPGVGPVTAVLENELCNKAASASTILEMPDDSYRDGETLDREERKLTLEIHPAGSEVSSSQEQGIHSLPKEVSREEGYNGSTSSDSDDARGKQTGVKIPIERRSYYQAPEKYRKTLRLSSEQIAQLNLQEGTNEVVFSVTTAYQGTTRCKCNIYKWRYDDKIVISDIDGTITKSDVLGHILPIVGKDWAQSGVAQLFTKIQNNGYRLLYLSARAIGQARVTREYLRSIKQDDLSLPDGPLLLNPTSLMSALHREVIERKPEEFKISCLRDIQALFPSHCKPFYAGYGNKINDVWAYRAVGIPIFRIFTINHRGELKHELTQTFQSSYLNMSCIVDQMFPARLEDTSEDYSNFVFWREPIAEFQVDLNISITSRPSSVASSAEKATSDASSKKGKK